MFSPKTLLAAILAFSASTALGVPAPAPEAAQAEWEIVKNITTREVPEALSKRTVGGIEICTDWHWMGTCGYAVQPLNQCIHLDSPWWHSISSMGPDQGTVCELYSDYSCTNLIYRDLRYPGSSDLSAQGVNDAIGSFMCHAG